MPNSLTILKKYKKSGNTAGDDGKDNQSEAGADNNNQDQSNVNNMDKKETKADEPPKLEAPKEP